VASLKTETVNQIADVKKDLKKKTNQKNTDLNKTRQEQEFAHEKICEEIRVVKEKMTKLAT
jgi:RNA polymerase-interacting CarD/CdnL/TRCF family regulator